MRASMHLPSARRIRRIMTATVFALYRAELNAETPYNVMVSATYANNHVVRRGSARR